MWLMLEHALWTLYLLENVLRPQPLIGGTMRSKATWVFSGRVFGAGKEEHVNRM